MQSKTFNVYNQENQAVQDAYALLSANTHFFRKGQNMRSFVLTSCKPKVGKTTLAINLAITLGESGWKTLLVDADTRKPPNGKRLNGASVSGLTDFLSGKSELENVLCSTNIPNLNYLACGRSYPNPLGLFTSLKFDEFLEKVCSEYDFVLLDTPALCSVVDASLIAAKADATLLVAEMGLSTVTAMKRAKDQLEKANANILGVILNKVKKKQYKKYFEDYNYFFNEKKFVKKRKYKNCKPAVVQTKGSGVVT